MEGDPLGSPFYIKVYNSICYNVVKEDYSMINSINNNHI